MQTITPQALKPLLTNGNEIAFLDIREHGQYGEGHPFFCVNLPYSELESRAATFLPCKHVSIILMDDGDGVAGRADGILSQLGYDNVKVLEGGVRGWEEAGFNLFKGVNVPSKTFGELVEHNTGTPSISAEELNERVNNGESIIVLDGRSPSEFTNMSLPFAQSCPNIELAHRAPQLFRDKNTTVVINCAGRTRSIIGAENLRQSRLENPVYALRNGTQGWKLAGFDLLHGEKPQVLPVLTAAQLEQNKEKAAALLMQWEIPMISPAELEKLQADENHTTYLLDVRTAEEFAKSHWPEAHHAPGGQLVQATDEYVAVRGARIVLCDDSGLRAAITAMWLRGMGHNASVLATDASLADHRAITPALISIDAPQIDISKAAQLVKTNAVLLDASRGMEYRKAHLEDAVWVTRSRLEEMKFEHNQTIIVTGSDQVLIAGVIADLALAGYNSTFWCDNSPEQWREAGSKIVETPDNPSQEDCIDYLFFVHDRHAGNMEAARQYLAWETGLLAQLDDQEKGVLNPPAPAEINNAELAV